MNMEKMLNLETIVGFLIILLTAILCCVIVLNGNTLLCNCTEWQDMIYSCSGNVIENLTEYQDFMKENYPRVGYSVFVTKECVNWIKK